MVHRVYVTWACGLCIVALLMHRHSLLVFLCACVTHLYARRWQRQRRPMINIAVINPGPALRGLNAVCISGGWWRQLVNLSSHLLAHERRRGIIALKWLAGCLMSNPLSVQTSLTLHNEELFCAEDDNKQSHEKQGSYAKYFNTRASSSATLS